MLWQAKNGSVSIEGVDLPYVSYGRGSKVAVLLPGLADGLTTVRGKALLLAQSHRRFLETFTIFVFSRKDVLPEGYSIRQMAADQAAAMTALGLEGACVMGVSQGGMIAQYLAIDHPELVGKLALAVTAPRVNDMIRSCVPSWIEMALQADHKSLMVDTAEKSYSPAYLKKYRASYPVLGFVGKPASYQRFLVNARAILAFDAHEEIGRIACPTLVIGGAEDKIVGIDASYELHEGIPGSRLHVYAGLGHATYEEAPDFNDRVFGFFAEE